MRTKLTASDTKWEDLQQVLARRWAHGASKHKADQKPGHKSDRDAPKEKRREKKKRHRKQLAGSALDWPALGASLCRLGERFPQSHALALATHHHLVLRGGLPAPQANKEKDKGTGKEMDWPVDFDWPSEADRFCSAQATPETLFIDGLLWSYALPGLSDQLSEAQWWGVLSVVNQLREQVADQLPMHSALRMMVAGEATLALAWGLQDLPTGKRLLRHGWSAVTKYLSDQDDRRGDAICGRTLDLVGVLSSTLRCETLGRCAFDKTLSNRLKGEIHELAQWTVHLMGAEGGQVLASPESSSSEAVTEAIEAVERTVFITADDGLVTAMQFATRTADKSLKNKLAVEMDLPESGLYCDQSFTFSLRRSWFDHHAWLVGSFQSRTEPIIKLANGRRWIIDGPWTVEIHVGNRKIDPVDDWQEVCWHSDDDVHYVEWEQAFSEGVTLQRHMMLLREDGTVLMGDAVFADDDATSGGDATSGDVSSGSRANVGGKAKRSGSADSRPREISYQCQLPVHESMQIRPEDQTREVIIGDNKPRALVLPLGLPEWNTGPSTGRLEIADHRLQLSMQGRGRLYTSLWFDLQKHRFEWPRTWRQLTVASDLKICDPSQAVAYRIQLGSQQWIVYRELGHHAARTFCGKHLAADFYCARFDPEDGTMENLLTLENHTASS